MEFFVLLILFFDYQFVLPGTTAFPFVRFPDHILRCASIGDIKSKSFADLYLVSNKRRNRWLRVWMLDISNRTHLIQNGLQGMVILVQLGFANIRNIAANDLGNKQDQKSTFFAKF